jgi:hypothetical protein
MRTARVVAIGILALQTMGCARRLSSVAPEPPASTPFLSLMEGSWRGTLEYRDYRDPAKRVTLPTLLHVTGRIDSAGARLHFVYDDGPGKTVVEDDRLQLDERLPDARWRSGTDHVQRYMVQSRSSTGNSRTVVLEGEGSDDNRPATIRETMTAGASTLRILKEVRFGTAFEFRHEYRFTRTE